MVEFMFSEKTPLPPWRPFNVAQEGSDQAKSHTCLPITSELYTPFVEVFVASSTDTEGETGDVDKLLKRPVEFQQMRGWLERMRKALHELFVDMKVRSPAHIWRHIAKETRRFDGRLTSVLDCRWRDVDLWYCVWLENVLRLHSFVRNLSDRRGTRKQS